MKIPKPQTLRKYGLSALDWEMMWKAQGGRCKICKNIPSTGRLDVDHKHVQGYKHMKPENKRKYVRGLLCWTCNKLIVGRGVTVDRLKSATEYLEDFERKLNNVQLSTRR